VLASQRGVIASATAAELPCSHAIAQEKARERRACPKRQEAADCVFTGKRRTTEAEHEHQQRKRQQEAEGAQGLGYTCRTAQS